MSQRNLRAVLSAAVPRSNSAIVRREEKSMKRIIPVLVVILAVAMSAFAATRIVNAVKRGGDSEATEETGSGAPALTELEKKVYDSLDSLGKGDDIPEDDFFGTMIPIDEKTNPIYDYVETIDSDETVVAANTCFTILSHLQSIPRDPNESVSKSETRIDHAIGIMQDMMFDFEDKKSVLDDSIEWYCDFGSGIGLTLKLATDRPNPETGLYDCTAVVEWKTMDTWAGQEVAPERVEVTIQ